MDVSPFWTVVVISFGSDPQKFVCRLRQFMHNTIRHKRLRRLATSAGDVAHQAQHNDQTRHRVLIDWTDHPQRLWEAIDGTLKKGFELAVHVGPRPNPIPVTFNRLGNNAWLSRLRPSNAVLLRKPFLDHVILEDWLLV